MRLHFYDAITTGPSSVEGQIVRFDSAIYGDSEPMLESTAVRVRDDLHIDLPTFDSSDLYNWPITDGIDEYTWTIKALELFTAPDTIHIGLGSSNGYDGHIRSALYRNLAPYPNTSIPPGSHHLDLATVIRACHLLRPESIPWPLIKGAQSDAQIRHALMWDVMQGTENRAIRIKHHLDDLFKSNPAMLDFAMRLSSPGMIKNALGFDDGVISSMRAIKPCFMSHQTIPNARRAGLFMPVAVDLMYPDIVYLADLECDLSELCDPGTPSIGQLVRKSADQSHLPLVRLNLSRVPFMAPLGAVRPDDAKRLGINVRGVKENVVRLRDATALIVRLLDEPIIGNTQMPADADFRMLAGEYGAADISLIKRLHATDISSWPGLFDMAADNRVRELGRRLFYRRNADHLVGPDLLAWRQRVRMKVAGGNCSPDRVAELLKQAEDIAATVRPPLGLSALSTRIKLLLGEP